MPNRVSNVSHLLGSPVRILAIVLALVFTVEAAVMFVLPWVFPDSLGDFLTAILDAVLLTSLCAPVLWWVIIGPLRRLAIQEHQRSETIVAGASEGILTFDREGEVVSCNQAGSAILGIPAESLIGQPIRRAIPGFPRSFASLPGEFRLQAVGRDGTKTPVQVSVSEYPLETDELFIAIFRDLTVAEQAERERITMARETEALRAQQMATLAQLATGVAHEIRNPLTSIKMLIQVNRSKFADEGLPTDDLELVEQEIRRIERSVNSLLDYARPEKDEFREFPLQDAVRRTMQLIEGRCKSQSVELQVVVPDQPVMIFGDAAKIHQLLLNLCLNALDAMPRQGTLGLTVRCDGDEAELALSDTGSGISEEMLGELFTPFVTTKVNGVGLGLGICRRIAQSHQGRLTGTNRACGGAQFSLILPLAGSRRSETALSTDSEDASCNAY